MIGPGIKNIIFDLGGVLLDIAPQRSIHAFRELGMADLIKPGGWGYDHEVFLRMEQGLLNERQFRDGVRELLPGGATDRQIDDAWCAMLISFPPEKIRLLQRLTPKYRLYLFSNTNSIHIRRFQELFSREFGFPLADLFVKDYYSSDIKLRKPDPRSYQFVLDDAVLAPSETLFIDDLDKNTAAAAQLGMQTICLTPDVDLVKLFK
ncbi:MAG: HAD family phosphatase [Prolixibacteraceae bacterium]